MVVEEVFTGESTLVFYVNGKKIIDNDVDPEWTLLYYLRNKLRLTGTKLGCAEGGCGACTVMVSKYNRKKKKIIHLAVNACLAAICSVHGCAVTTIEGIGSTRTKLHPVQERLAKAHGSQCGFCTPGIIMSMYALLRANPKPKMLDMEIAFQGNLCRCTGYRPIIEGLRTFTEEWEKEQEMERVNGTPEKLNGTPGKLNGTTEKLNGTPEKLNGTTEKLNGTPEKLNGTTEKLNGTPKKLNGTPEKLNGTTGKLNGTTEKLNGTPEKLNGTTEKLNGTPEKLNGTTEKLNGTPEKLNGTTEKLNGTPEKLNGTTEKLNGTPEKLNGTPEKLNGTTEKLGVMNCCAMGENCCQMKRKGYYKEPEEILFSQHEFVPYDPSQEVIFPPELMLNSQLDEQKLAIRGPRAVWYRPTCFNDVLLLKKTYPNAKIINGNSEVGVEVKFKNFVYPVLINPAQVSELTEIVYMNKGIKFGAAVTLNEINDVLRQEIATQPEYKTRVFKGAVSILHWFAGKQIRNVSAIGGNLMTGSPISDMNPVLMAANVDLYVNSVDSTRIIKMDHTFFTGYRRNVIKPEEVLTAILIPYSHEDQYFNAYKQAKRRDDDIAIVNCAANVEFQPGTDIVKNILIAYGGVAPCTTLVMKTREKIIGKRWNDQMVEEAFNSIMAELPLAPNVPGGKVSYRQTLTLSLFFKFYLFVREKLSQKYQTVAALPERIRSAVPSFHSGELKSSQYFQMVPKHQEKVDAVGRTLVHVNAFKQATGEALYCDDIPKMENELYLTLVLSTQAHAKILNIDASKALAMPGVRGFFTYKDIEKGRNDVGAIFHDEKVFCEDKVTCQGQVIAAVVADNQIISQRAAKQVKIDYETLSPVIVSIEDAIEHKSFLGKQKRILRGNPAEAFKTCDHVIEGVARMGGQEHFYLETQCCLVVPKEDELDVFTSSQNAAEIQKLVSHVLGVPCNRVAAKVKRIGGGFGGKESRASLVALPCAVAAHIMKRPIRCMLDRDEDMMISGTRHPFLSMYKVGFNKDGKIIAADVDIYNNAGCSMDLSCSVLDRALFHVENSYLIPHVDVKGMVCYTNLPSNTAFRGFGGPQGMFIAENIMEHIADCLNKPPEEIRYINLYKEGDSTHYNQPLTLCTLTRCWEECYYNSEYEKRKKEVEEFNRKNRYKKRGISIIPTKFGIAFTELCLNQSGALVHVYTDGSVLMSHGGVEIGQGINTKMIQVASRVLGVDASNIYISEMASDKVPNTSATAASSGSDLNGMAILDACQKIVERIKPFKTANPNGTWKDWVVKAYRERVSLSATGFYRTPEIGYSFETNSGLAFNYFTYGAAVSEVEVDCLTGDHQVLRTDIVMDLGESLNPAIDIGQVEGGFIQGQGLFTIEELIYSPTGTVFSRGPGVYKIPGFADIPLEFNVSLLRGAPNPRAVYSSKAVGEPPLFLASSIFFAIKHAIKAAREEEGIKGHFRFDSPATSDRIRIHCVDKITERFPEPDPKSYTPWNMVP